MPFQDADRRGWPTCTTERKLGRVLVQVPSAACAPGNRPASTITCNRRLGGLAVNAHSRTSRNQRVQQDQEDQKGNVPCGAAPAVGDEERSRITGMDYYLIGDVQGCCDALDALLAKIGFFALPRDRHLRARRTLVSKPRARVSLDTLAHLAWPSAMRRALPCSAKPRT